LLRIVHLHNIVFAAIGSDLDRDQRAIDLARISATGKAIELGSNLDRTWIPLKTLLLRIGQYTEKTAA
jgi:hypothetical protein